MREHTPGPWMSHVDNQSEYTHVITALIRPATSSIIADVVKHPNSEADARLIAAAPELLEQLKFLVESCEEAGWHKSITEESRTVIAEATGETK